MKSVSKFILSLICFCVFSKAFAAPDFHKVNEPLSASDSNSLQIKSAFVSIFADNVRIGSGSLSVNPANKNEYGVLTAKHVVDMACSASMEIEFRINGISWKNLCSNIFASASSDESFIKVPLNLAEQLGPKNFLPTQVNSEKSSHQKAYIYCDKSTRASGESVTVKSNGKYLNTFGENRPGCSGSSIVENGHIIGVMKGFKLEDRSLLYTTPAKDLVPLQKLKKQKFLENRGDPIDGGDKQRDEMVYLMPDLAELKYLSASRRIIHIPSIVDHGWIPAQSPTRLVTNVFLSTRNYESSKLNADFWFQPKVGQLPSWNMDFPIFNSDYEMQFNVNLEKDERSGSYIIKNHLPTENYPIAWLDLKQKSKIGLWFPMENPKWEIELTPGHLKIHDKKVGEFSLYDPNIGYRSVLIEGNGFIAVYSFEIHAQDFDGSRFMEVVVTRTLAKNKQLLRQGDVLDYNFLIVSLKNSPFEPSDLKWVNR